MSDPFLKWAGGKRFLADKILEVLPANIENYYEPMIGAGAIFFALEGRFARAKINDVNKELVNTYTVIRDKVNVLIDCLSAMEIQHRIKGKRAEDYYYSIREETISEYDTVRRAARTIYLNRTCFNGLYRVNKKGLFNVPYGHYENPTICNRENLQAVSKSLQNTIITSVDFYDAVQGIGTNDAAYFDPPYWPVAKGSFTSYTDNGFGSKDHQRLAELAHKLKKNGVHAVFSNSNVRSVRKLYDGLIIEKVSAPRRINSNGNGRGNIDELLIRTR